MEDDAQYFIFRDALLKCGISEDDFVLLHSDTGKMSLGEVVKLYSFLKRFFVPNGTIAFPTFNFGFCRGEIFDYRKTPSQMGLLTELARRDPEASRVFHPIYGFAFFGKLAPDLKKIHNYSSYAEDSLFGELHRRRGKILILNLQFDRSFTFAHYVEEMVGCDYRYIKEFTGKVIDQNRVESMRTYQMLVRDLDKGVVTHLMPLQNYLEEKGLLLRGKLLGLNTLTVSADLAFEAIREKMKKEPHFLRKIQK